MITLPARPESLTLSPQHSALIVVDMQNAYASQGGYLDLAGFDVSATRPVIDNINLAVAAARAAGMLIIWFQNGWDEQYVEAGGPGSPNYHKSNALKTMRQRPELQGKLLAKGGWDYQLVDELRPGRAISSCRNRATAAFSIPRSTAFYAAAVFATWYSPASPPTSASNRRYAMVSSSNTSAWCWRMPPIRQVPPSRNRRRYSTLKPFSAGSATSAASVAP